MIPLHRAQPGKRNWDFDDPKEMKRRYPKLFAKYGYVGRGSESVRHRVGADEAGEPSRRTRDAKSR
jgi:hypothetical protein